VEKVNIKFKETKKIGFKFYDEEIEVTSFISFEDELGFFEEYLDSYFEIDEDDGSVKYDYHGAEYALMLNMLDVLTNVKIKDGDEISIDIMNGEIEKLFLMSVEHISNYGNFRSRLDRVVSDAKEVVMYEKSLANIVQNIMSNGLDYLSNFSDSLTPEKIKEVKESFASLLEDVKDSPVEKLLQESVK